MGEINREALAGLTATVEALLQQAAEPSVQLTLLVAPTCVTPTGLGGFVGINEHPQGGILGRRLQATALVTVGASHVGPLNSAVTRVTRDFLGADRATLVEQGIFRLVLDDIGPQATSGSGDDMTVERNLMFNVLYEFLKKPDESEDLILEVPINLDAT